LSEVSVRVTQTFVRGLGQGYTNICQRSRSGLHKHTGEVSVRVTQTFVRGLGQGYTNICQRSWSGLHKHTGEVSVRITQTFVKCRLQCIYIFMNYDRQWVHDIFLHCLCSASAHWAKPASSGLFGRLSTKYRQFQQHVHGCTNFYRWSHIAYPWSGSYSIVHKHVLWCTHFSPFKRHCGCSREAA